MTECPLTETQIEIVKLLADGKTYTDIEQFLGIKRGAIYRRMDRAFIRTGTLNVQGIVALALRRGWIK